MAKHYRRIYERVAAELSKKIVSGEYKVEERLPSERELAAQFSVSRPSIRESIIALELDGLVEVRTGSGVYVISNKRPTRKKVGSDLSMFEILEARRAFESEAAALAAARISDEDLSGLEALINEMSKENTLSVEKSEDADRRFHLEIARITNNNAIYQTVEMLWDARRASPQTQHFLKWVRRNGVKPRIDEHSRIMNALRSRNANAARQAMLSHLNRVMESVLDATEIEEIEKIKAKVNERRNLYGHTGN